jgi:probable HAF family extracellular repeat protein
MFERAQVIATATSLALLVGCSQAQSGPQTMPQQVPSASVRKEAAPTATTTGYTIKDLGALPGDNTSEIGRGTLTYSKALNDAGQEAGASSSPTADVATLFGSGGDTNINTLNASVSLGNAINDSGQVAGEESSTSDTCSCFHAFLYSNGVMKNIEDTSIFPNGSQAYGINKSGQVVGAGFPTGAGYPFHAFLYSAGKMTDLNPFNGYQSIARSINDSGEIIGSSTGDNTKANPESSTWLYANGKITSLSSTNNGYFINNNGQIAGENSAGDGTVYANGVWTDLGKFPGSTYTIALGVNDNGIAVGIAFFPVQSYHPFRPGKHVGVLFTSNGPIDLTTLLPSNSGFTVTDAVAINDAGQIAADAKTSTGQQHAVLLTPH